MVALEHRLMKAQLFFKLALERTASKSIAQSVQ